MKRYDYYGNYKNIVTGAIRSYEQLKNLSLQQYEELEYTCSYSEFAKGYIRCWIDCNNYVPIDKDEIDE